MEDAVSSAGRPNTPVTSAPICRMMRPVCHRKKVLNIMSSTLTSPPINELIYNDRVLVFILAYNEEGAIEEVVSSVAAALTGADILVIDDGSDDMTRVVARRAGAMVVRHPFNLGIGGAMQTGLKFARRHNYDYAIRLDGDGQHNADEIAGFLHCLRTQQADLVVGSRFLEATYDWQIPILRRMGIRLYSAAVSAVTGCPSTDTTSGYCGMNRRAIDVLATYLPQDFPDVESRVIVHKAGLRQLELPVHMRARSAGVSSINLFRSIYYAMKVTIAVATSAIKDIAVADAPRASTRESLNADSIRTKSHSGALQPYPPVGDAPTDT